MFASFMKIISSATKDKSSTTLVGEKINPHLVDPRQD